LFHRLSNREGIESFPATGANASEVADGDIYRLLTDQNVGGLAQGLGLSREGVDGAWDLRCWGEAPAEAFFMPFPALVEWLAQWAASAGWIGFYHRRSLDHTTMVYFSGG